MIQKKVIPPTKIKLRCEEGIVLKYAITSFIILEFRIKMRKRKSNINISDFLFQNRVTYKSIYAFFTRLIRNNSTHAPPTAIIICQSNPPPPIPSLPAIQPPMIPPTIPTMILPSNPKPAPFQIWPASQPEIAPISKKYKNAI